MHDTPLGIATLLFVVAQHASLAVLIGATLCAIWLRTADAPGTALVRGELAKVSMVGAVVLLVVSALRFAIDAAPSDAAESMESMGDAESLATVAGWIGVMHRIAVSTWIGTVVIAAFKVMPHLRDTLPSTARTCASFVRALSKSATYVLVFVVGTGIYNATMHIDSLDHVIESAYGQVLMFKVLLVSVAAALGAYNRFIEMPALMPALEDASTREPTPLLRRFARVLVTESIVLMAVLITAAILVSFVHHHMD